MQPRQLIDFLGVVEKLKCNTRHSWTSEGRHESVAEHSWRVSLMALLVADEFPELDIFKVVRMCLIHDFGEAITGDIPSFLKTEDDREKEDRAVDDLLKMLPDNMSQEYSELFDEMEKLETPEAKLYKALDKLEAIIQHNEAPFDTWIPREYTENIIYGTENVAHSEFLKALKEEIKQDTVKKIENGK